MATRRPRARPERGSWSTGTEVFILKANLERSQTRTMPISSVFWCDFGVVCFTVAREGSSDGESKTTHVDGIASWPLRAGGSLRACGGDFLCDGRRGVPEPQVPADDVSAGSSTLVERGAGARGRRGSRKRGIYPTVAADAGQEAREEQEH